MANDLFKDLADAFKEITSIKNEVVREVNGIGETLKDSAKLVKEPLIQDKPAEPPKPTQDSTIEK